MLSVKQINIKYHFLSLWYDSAWNWTPVSQPIGKHSTTKPMEKYVAIQKQVHSYIYLSYFIAGYSRYIYKLYPWNICIFMV